MMEELRLRLEESELNLRECEDALHQAGAIGRRLLCENEELRRELEECRVPAKARLGGVRHGSSPTSSSRRYSVLLSTEDEDGAEENLDKPRVSPSEAVTEVAKSKEEKWHAAMRELVEENQELERECGLLTDRCRSLEEKCQAQAGNAESHQADAPRAFAPDEPRMAAVVRNVISGMRREQREGLARAAVKEEQNWVEAQSCQVELRSAQESLGEVQRRNNELQRQLDSLQVEVQRAELRREAAEREALRLREELRACGGGGSGGGGCRGPVMPPPPLEGSLAGVEVSIEDASLGNLEQQLERLTRWHRRTSHHAQPPASAARAEKEEGPRSYLCRGLGRCLTFRSRGGRHAECRRPSFGN